MAAIINRRIIINKFSFTFIFHQRFTPFTSDSTVAATPHNNIPPPINPTHLRRVCTVLYQQQNSPDLKLHSKLLACNFNLSHEFFLQVCNTFPLSWRPVYRFFQFTETDPNFTHTAVSFNKLIDVVGKSRNIDLLWGLVQEMGRRRLVTDKTFVVALRTLAAARELKKCVEFFHLMDGYGFGYSLVTLNKVVEKLCGCKLVDEAKFLVMKLNEWIKADGVTYKWLIKGFCNVGDLIEASKIWNLMVDEGFEPEMEAVEEMMNVLFKTNKFVEALKLFQAVRSDRMNDLIPSTYSLTIRWLCNKAKVKQAYVVFNKMHKRGLEADNSVHSSLIYGLLARGRRREAYDIMKRIEKPDLGVYHALIKGLLRLKRANEATQVFREMIERGCEPIMHTYIMLLQGHLGKRGRKGLDPLVNFDSIFVGGLVKSGKSLEATKYVERLMKRGLEVPRFDYNKFLHYYSNEEGVVMFREVGNRLREAGLVDLADIFQRYGEKMTTRDRRRNRAAMDLK
ncbi:putative pentatricopeptide repeat-containing protein At1g26500 [Benincasa hispida]|uniref:putative pentatricopeptide repeat-containing protein At1g26500 n=1 Tax=Benincasa hispida TaxID=102211 RepID=UPI0018FF5D15|nr:putative pentatricopeptide repeat-containing protein At1g26500 [Benincasa hispida]XP_038884842.1 putative pentatricopeptide repeat-containing protein At1g26500 [Benincasa hispida]XP_038884843.1 putative pentatricopeptide repeat-containing protein At1g26500 [Benincasa hispida]XP_038884844.1 putative pentatricopeptide repeat-containing protein At1g26500 [Benincasa hispida]XP_038884845.1 putative pentatricopeptide repeat-containing protein At1g26500 [Benincasa hispida]XP_038884846.1 putative p